MLSAFQLVSSTPILPCLQVCRSPAEMPGPSALLLRNCRVLDASAGTLSSEPLAVLVVNNRIAAVDRPWSLRITERLGQAAAAAGAAGAAAEAAASEAAAALMAGTVRQPGKCGPWTVQDIDCRGLTLMPVSRGG